LINNRQNGRRRGRGGGPRTPNNAPSPGNRQDNRSRGNASQLHEKYKALARDAQLGGDRVQTEYYLQFADHYFRVLNETRARFEEQRPRRDDYQSDQDDDQDDGINAMDDGDQDEGEEQPRSFEERPAREPRFERSERSERSERQPREARNSEPRSSEARNSEARNSEDRPRPARVRAVRNEAEDSGEARISLDSLPPAIASVSDSEDVVRAPRRRTRRPRTDNDEAEIAPAA
jgi:hypothetical protein